MPNNKRFERHYDLVDTRKLAKTKVMMIGLGSLGSWAMLNMIKMGIQHIIAYDNDKVNVENFSNQIYSHIDAGLNKTDAMTSIIDIYLDEDDKCKFKFVNKKFTGGTFKYDIIISAVDNMEARKDIWKSARDSLNCQLFLDARMGGSLIQMYCIDMSNQDDIKWFEDPNWENLFKDGKEEPLKCTEKGIIHAAQTCAAHYTNAIASWSNGTLKNYPRWIQMDLTWKSLPVYSWREGAKCLPMQPNVLST